MIGVVTMQYKVNDVKRILNISKDTLRYFDNKHLISSRRDEKNNYRYFRSEDINKLFAYKMYRSLLFNMKDAEFLISGHSTDSLHSMLEKQISYINAEQIYLENAKQHLHLLAAKLESWSNFKGGFEITTSPNCYYHYNQTYQHFIEADNVFHNTYEVLNLMPNLWPCFSYNIDNQAVPYKFSYGYGYYTDGGAPLDQLIHFPAVQCLHTFFTLEKDLNEMIESVIQEAETYCTHTHYAIYGNAFGNILHEMIEQNKRMILFDMYIPIRKLPR